MSLLCKLAGNAKSQAKMSTRSADGTQLCASDFRILGHGWKEAITKGCAVTKNHRRVRAKSPTGTPSVQVVP